VQRLFSASARTSAARSLYSIDSGRRFSSRRTIQTRVYCKLRRLGHRGKHWRLYRGRASSAQYNRVECRNADVGATYRTAKEWRGNDCLIYVYICQQQCSPHPHAGRRRLVVDQRRGPRAVGARFSDRRHLYAFLLCFPLGMGVVVRVCLTGRTKAEMATGRGYL